MWSKFLTLFTVTVALTTGNAQSIVDIASGDDRFTTLVELVSKAGLVDALGDESASLSK